MGSNNRIHCFMEDSNQSFSHDVLVLNEKVTQMLENKKPRTGEVSEIVLEAQRHESPINYLREV